MFRNRAVRGRVASWERLTPCNRSPHARSLCTHIHHTPATQTHDAFLGGGVAHTFGTAGAQWPGAHTDFARSPHSPTLTPHTTHTMYSFALGGGPPPPSHSGGKRRGELMTPCPGEWPCACAPPSVDHFGARCDECGSLAWWALARDHRPLNPVSIPCGNVACVVRIPVAAPHGERCELAC